MESRIRLINALEANRVPELAHAGFVTGPEAVESLRIVEGSTAFVVRLPLQDGGSGALRLPISHHDGGGWERHYRAIEASFPESASALLPADVGFLERGVTLVGRRLPAVAMEWIDGPTLLHAVDRAALAGNQNVLVALRDAFRETIELLADKRVIHGDLSATNLMLRSSGDLVLVDLDTLQWHGMRQRGDSSQATAAYRHPGKGATANHQEAFASLLIVASLCALSDAPSLRDQATREGEELLFSSWDLAEPARSTMFERAREHVSPSTRTVLSLLARACASEPYRAPELLSEAMGIIESAPEVLSAEPTATATPDDDDGQWDVSSVVRRLKAELGDHVTVEPVHEVEPFSETWPSDEPIPDEPTPTVLDIPARPAVHDAQVYTAPAREPIDLRRLQREEDVIARLRERIHDAARRRADSDAIRYAEMLEERSLPLDPETRQIVRSARERREVRDRLERALGQQDNIALAELAVSGELSILGDADRTVVTRVLQAIEWPGLQRALESDDDHLILQWYDEDLFEGSQVVPSSLRQRVDLARNRVAWLEEMRLLLRQRDARRIRQHLRDEPDGSLRRLSTGERRRALQLIERQAAIDAVQEAIRSGDHGEILNALMTVERVGARIEDKSMWASVQGIVERATIIEQIRAAADKTPPDDRKLASLMPVAERMGMAHDPMLHDAYAWERLEAIVLRGAAIRRIRAAISRDDDRAIRQAAYPDTTGALAFLSESEANRVEAARSRRLVKGALGT